MHFALASETDLVIPAVPLWVTVGVIAVACVVAAGVTLFLARKRRG